jgi:Zn-dependent protease
VAGPHGWTGISRHFVDRHERLSPGGPPALTYRLQVPVYDLSKRRRNRAVRPHPIFLAFVAVAVVGGWLAWTKSESGSELGDFGVFLFVIGAWVVTLCLHEFGHAYAAYRAGDREVEAAGYLTLNPLKYSHPVLSILLPLFFIVSGGIGLPGGAVYLHRHAFRSRAMQSVAAAAGPAVNVVFGVVLLLLSRSHLQPALALLAQQPVAGDHARFWAGVAFLGFLQITAAVLNLLPIPGLDGYAIIEPYLDPETVRIGEKIKPWGMLGVIVLLLYVDKLNHYFFDFLYWICEKLGSDQLLIAIGHEAFKFWAKPAM